MNSKKAGIPVKTVIVCFLLLIVICTAFFVIYKTFVRAPSEGNKTITLEITHLDQASRSVTINTDAEYLREALVDGDIDFQGEDSSFGFYMTSFDGYVPDDSNEEWWGYTKSGEYVETSLDQTVIEDGDRFEFTLNIGYDF